MSARVDRWRTRPRNWVLVAAAVAAIVCAVGWPLLTGYAAGTAVSIAALWYGVRKLITEQRHPLAHPRTDAQASGPQQVDESEAAQHEVVHDAREQLRKAVNGELCLCGNDGCTTPDAVIAAFADEHGSVVLRGGAGYLRYLGEDQAAEHLDASGPEGCPDASGPDPDTTGQHGADQPGPDPDDADTAVRGVQGWMAHDLHRALGRGSTNTQHQGFKTWADWWTDLIAQVRRGHAVAVARGVVPAGWYCSHCGRGDAAATADQVAEQFQRAEQAGAQLSLARDAHRRLAAYLAGFADVLDDSDRGPWADTGAVALADLNRALNATEGSSW